MAKDYITQKEKINKNFEDIKVDVYNISGKKSGTVSLPGNIFNNKVSPSLLAQAVRVYQANQRSGMHSTKSRGEVTGSSRKIYKQKGTGRARHGDIKAPIFVGGGIAHGPHPRDYSLNFPKNMKRKALAGALSQKLEENHLKVVSGFTDVTAKTHEVVQALYNLKISDKKKIPNVFLVTPGKLDNLFLAGRNIEGLTMKSAKLINAYDILRFKEIIFMKEAVEVITAGAELADMNEKKPVKKIIEVESKVKIEKVRKVKTVKKSVKKVTLKKKIKG